MIDCERFKIAFTAGSRDLDPELASHSDDCPDCAKFAESMRDLDRKLLACMSVEVPRGLAATLQEIPGYSSKGKSNWFIFGGFALAAAFLLGIGFSSVYRSDLIFQPATLQQVVYEHILHEPQALNAVFPVQEAVVNTTLKEFGVSLKKSPGKVMHVTLCPIGDTFGLHLVVQGKRGPVTFLFLPTKTLDKSLAIVQERFVGYIKPSPHGIIAVVGEKGELLGETESAVRGALKWL